MPRSQPGLPNGCHLSTPWFLCNLPSNFCYERFLALHRILLLSLRKGVGESVEMNPLVVSRIATRGPRPWTCSACRGQLAGARPSAFLAARQFASGKGSSHGDNGRKSRSSRVLLYASTGAAAVASTALAFSDDIKNSYEAAERTGRVIATLAICINEYGTTAGCDRNARG